MKFKNNEEKGKTHEREGQEDGWERRHVKSETRLFSTVKYSKV